MRALHNEINGNFIYIFIYIYIYIYIYMFKSVLKSLQFSMRKITEQYYNIFTSIKYDNHKKNKTHDSKFHVVNP